MTRNPDDRRAAYPLDIPPSQVEAALVLDRVKGELAFARGADGATLDRVCGSRASNR